MTGELTTRRAQVALIDVALAGHRVVAVGERGYIGLSDDAGKTWRQAVVPVSVSLTAVHFPTPEQGWAVGHGGTVLHSTDGGQTWAVQLDGTGAARLVGAAAKAAEASGDSSGGRQVQAAERLLAEGPDKPFLAVHFKDARHGYVTGAYGLAFETHDAGVTWSSLMSRLDNSRSLHLYAVDTQGDSVCLAGEQGTVLRSGDGGATFRRIESPYRGTYFAVLCDGSENVFVAGLNGNAYWLGGDGSSTKTQGGGNSSIVTIRSTSQNGVLAMDQSGQSWFSHDGGKTLHAAAQLPLNPLSSFVVLPDGRLMAVGLRGVVLAGPTITGARSFK